MIDRELHHTVTRRKFINRLMGSATALALAGTILPGAVQESSAAGSESQNTRVRMKTTATVNFKAQPDYTDEILAVLPAGTTVFAKDVVINGYRAVTYKRVNGWILAAYLV